MSDPGRDVWTVAGLLVLALLGLLAFACVAVVCGGAAGTLEEVLP